MSRASGCAHAAALAAGRAAAPARGLPAGRARRHGAADRGRPRGRVMKRPLSPEAALDILQHRPDARLTQTMGAHGAEFYVVPGGGRVRPADAREDHPATGTSSSRTPACFAIPRRAGGTCAMHEPLPHRTAVQADVAVAHVLYRDIETRSKVSLKKVGAHKYAADPSTEVLCVAYRRRRRSRAAVAARAIRCRRNSSKLQRIRAGRVAAHNDAFESAIEQHVLAPRYGWPTRPARAPPLHHGDVPGAWAAGEAGRRG